MTEEIEQKVEEYIEKNGDKWKTESLTIDEIVRLAIIGFAQQEMKLVDELNICQELLGKEKVTNIEQSLELTEAKEIIREFTLGFDTQGQYDRLQEKAKAFINKE